MIKTMNTNFYKSLEITRIIPKVIIYYMSTTNHLYYRTHGLNDAYVTYNLL